MHRRLVVASLVLIVSGCLAAAAIAITPPGRTRTEPTPILALSVSGTSVVYAVADNASKSDCAHLYVWHTTGTKTTLRFGGPKFGDCIEGSSTGDGIPAVAMSSTRVVWLQYVGGNLRDWEVFTATPTKPTPRQIAFVEQDVDLPSPIVIGRSITDGVPYAVNDKLTYLGDNGSAIFKWTAPATVQLISTGTGPNGAEVAAALSNGNVDVLSHSGSVLQTYTYPAGTVTAIALNRVGVLVQNGANVDIRKGAAKKTVTLPAGAKMFDYGQGYIYYTRAGAIHAFKTADSTDVLLVAATPGKNPLASYATYGPRSLSTGGFAWAIANKLNWDCGSCIRLSP